MCCRGGRCQSREEPLGEAEEFKQVHSGLPTPRIPTFQWGGALRLPGVGGI